MPKDPRLDTAEEVLEAEIKDLEQPMLRSWTPWVGGLIALLALGTVISFVVISQRAPIGVARLDAHLIVPRGAVPEPPRTFQWSRVDGAASYVVTIEASGGETLMVRPVEGTLLAPSDVEMAHFQPGDYTWSIEARNRKGATLGHGRTAFRVTAEAEPSAEPPPAAQPGVLIALA